MNTKTYTTRHPRITGTAKRPRLSVFRSDKHVYAQLIDDVKGHTLAAVNDSTLEKGAKLAKAYAAGQKIADMAKSLKIKTVCFDRGSFRYHGRIQAVAEGARANGLEF